MSKILFVDGDPRAGDEVRNLLPADWDAAFAVDGTAAIEALEAAHDGGRAFDAVVTELELEGTDGLTLLSRIRDAHPRTVRLVLAGHAPGVNRLQASGVAHQFLTKPCDRTELLDAIGRSIALHVELADDRLIQAVTATKTLPAVPQLYHRLNRELASEDPSIDRIAAIVAQDPAMTAKILQIVNSAFVGLRRRVTDAKQAVILLGMDMVVALVLIAEVFGSAPVRGPAAASVARLWESASRVAALAKEVVKASGGSREHAEEAFLAGMLHDCGKLILATNWPQKFAEVEAAGGESLREVIEFGADHGAMGAHLMSVWGLPDTIVEAVAFHHHPGASGARALSPLTAVHVAHALEHRPEDDDEPLDLDLRYLREVGVAEHVDRWLAVAEDVEYARMPA